MPATTRPSCGTRQHSGGTGYSPRVDHEIPLADIAEAHTLAENGSGKVVVTQP